MKGDPEHAEGWFIDSLLLDLAWSRTGSACEVLLRGSASCSSSAIESDTMTFPAVCARETRPGWAPGFAGGSAHQNSQVLRRSQTVSPGFDSARSSRGNSTATDFLRIDTDTIKRNEPRSFITMPV